MSLNQKLYWLPNRDSELALGLESFSTLRVLIFSRNGLSLVVERVGIEITMLMHVGHIHWDLDLEP